MKKSIYISRPVINTEEIKVWARQQGFQSCINDEAMHVTLAFDRRQHDWSTLPLEAPDQMEIIDPDDRAISIFRGGAVVLEIYSQDLVTRWSELVQSGLYWKWPDYKPHITLTYCAPDNFKPSRIIPFPDRIILGREEILEVTMTWAKRLEEFPL